MVRALIQNTNQIVYDRNIDDKAIKWQATSEVASEKSYKPLLTYNESLDLFVALNCNFTWLFYNLLGVNILYFFTTYEILFDATIREHDAVMIMKILCNVLLIIDTFTTLIYYANRNSKRKVVLGEPSLLLLFTQLISSLLLPLQLAHVFYSSDIIDYFLLAAFVLRYHKLYIYTELLKKLPGETTVWNLYRKNCIVGFVILHSSVCIWMSIGCLESPAECAPKYDGFNTYWNAGQHEEKFALGRNRSGLSRNKVKKLTPPQNYLLCIYYVTGALTSVGYGGPSLRNTPEELISIVLMLIYIICIYGLCNAELSRYYVQLKSLAFERMHRRQAMVHDFRTKSKQRQRLKVRVLKYYDEFWENDKGVKTASLLSVIPHSLFVDTQTEIYWVFLNKCTFLLNTSEAFRKAVACKMYAEIMNKGDVLFEVDTLSEKVCYIARGNVEVLSAVDFVSPILSLGKGTCLGKMNLLYSSRTRLKVIVATYTVVYILKKSDFWQVVSVYQKLKEAASIHKNYKQLLTRARQRKRKEKPKEQIFRKWRCVVTKNILTGFKEKIKEYCHHPDKLGLHAHEHPKRHYMYSKIHSQKTYDEIFGKISFPWTLQHKSQFLEVWNIAILGVVIYVSIAFPYIAAFHPEEHIYAIHLVTALYIFDVVLSVFTSVDTKTDTIRKVEEIGFTRMENYTFFLDVFAALPLHWCFVFDSEHKHKKIACIANLNTLFKLYKVDAVISTLEMDSKINTVLLKSIKYIIYLSYFGYILGCIFYMITCFDSMNCVENSWIEAFYRTLLDVSVYDPTIKIQDPRESPIMFSFLNMILVLSGSSPCLTVNMVELTILIVVACFGVLILMHQFAGYASTVTLHNRDSVKYMDFLDTVENYMDTMKLDPRLKMRVVRFLEHSWRTNKAVSNKELYVDCPEHLYNMNQIARFRIYLRHMEFLKFASSELLDFVAVKCTLLSMPPSEYLIYSGQKCMSMYILLKGFCEIVDGAVTQKVISPGQCINTMEVLMGFPSLVSIRLITHCLLLKLLVRDIEFIMRKFPTYFNMSSDFVDETTVKRVYTRVRETFLGSYDARSESDKSFFVFPTLRRDPLYIDFQKGCQSSKMKGLRFFLMRRTILPYGKFLRQWTISRAVASFFTSVLVPTSFIHYQYFPQIQYLLWMFHAFSVIDVYMRLHICYYNHKGILVTHPIYTAKYYLSHSFILDLLGMLPSSWLFIGLINMQEGKLLHVLNFNVLFQMHRVPDLFRNRRFGIYELKNTWFQCLKYTPFVIVVITLLTCILLYISGEDTFVNGTYTLIVGRFSWLTTARDMKFVDVKNPYNFFLIAFYYTTITITGVSFDLFNPCDLGETVFVIICILVGFMLKLHITVKIAHDRYSVDHKLTAHRNYMVQMMQYMNNVGLSKSLQAEVSEHKEHVWRRTHGVTTHHLIELLHRPLQMDFVYTLYKKTLTWVPVFSGASHNFYRVLGINLREMYLREDSVVIKLNDLVDKVYIIHRGAAVVIGPDNSIFCELRRGSMFGNIDNVACTRSMVTVVATTCMDLLVIETPKMYKIFDGFEYLYHKLQHYILLENFSYIQSYLEESEFVGFRTKKERGFRLFIVKMMLAEILIPFQVVLVHVVPCLLSSYNMAFDTHINWEYILCGCDVMHVINVALYFFKPYYDEHGELVTDFKLIKKRYLHSMTFYLDVFTIPPYVMLAYCFEEVSYWKKMIGAYRMLRIINVYRCYETSTSTFGNKVIIFRMAKILTYVLCIVHCCACFMYYLGCPKQRCQLGYWVYNRRRYVCKDEYVCSLDIVVSMISTTGYPIRVPTSINGMLVCIAIVIGSIYLQATVVGDLIALVRNSTYNLSVYNFELQLFMTYLENGYVSPPFIKRMREYCRSLWVIGRGRQVPTYLLTLPPYLDEKIKVEAYGLHIFDNIMFENCHKDFLRILVTKLNMLHFLPDDTICHQEDINNSMFFIHRGGVHVYSISHSEEIHVDELQSLDSFGLMQGLYPNTPHTHTYKANGITSILTLQYEDWSTLLHFFPASKFEIYSNISHLLATDIEELKKQKLEQEQVDRMAMDDSDTEFEIEV